MCESWLFERLALGDVAERGRNTTHAEIVHEVGREELAGAPGAVQATDADFAGKGRFVDAVEHPRQQMAQLLLIVEVHQLAHIGPDECIAHEAPHALGGGALVGDRAFGVEDDDHVAVLRTRERKALLAAAQCELLGSRDLRRALDVVEPQGESFDDQLLESHVASSERLRAFRDHTERAAGRSIPGKGSASQLCAWAWSSDERRWRI